MGSIRRAPRRALDPLCRWWCQQPGAPTVASLPIARWGGTGHTLQGMLCPPCAHSCQLAGLCQRSSAACLFCSTATPLPPTTQAPFTCTDRVLLHLGPGCHPSSGACSPQQQLPPRAAHLACGACATGLPCHVPGAPWSPASFSRRLPACGCGCAPSLLGLLTVRGSFLALAVGSW